MSFLKNLFKKEESSCCNVKIEEVKDVKETESTKEDSKGDSCCSK
ncbi:hypothetical protein [Brevibacillus sp. SYSU BS000544]